MKVIYIAHPLGRESNERACNIAQAERWFIFCADQGNCPMAPWLTLARHWTEERRGDGIAIDLRTIERCDELWLCGPRISPGMQLEKDHAHKFGIPVVDWTGVELEP